MEVLPTYLYKYREIRCKDDLFACSNIQALFNSYAVINSRKRFDDPEDSRIHLIPPSQNMLTQFRREYPQHKFRLEHLIEEGITGKLEKMFNDMVDQYGIYCFSSTGVNYRMWNQYAEGQTGFCIEFMREKFFPGRKIEYQEKIASMSMLPLIKIYLDIPGADKQFAERIHKALHIKLNKWKYEDEYRFLNTGYLPKDELYEKKAYSPSSVLSVIFGKNMKPEHKDFIRKNIPFQVAFKQADEVTYRKIQAIKI